MEAQDPSISAAASGSDELGVYLRVSVDTSTYGETAILKSAYWFTDRCYLFLSKNRKSGVIDVEFRLKEGDSIDKLKVICGEFCNNLLDQTVRQKVLQETSSVRDVLLKKAFFEAKATLPDKMDSNEIHLPTSDQSYHDDPHQIGKS